MSYTKEKVDTLMGHVEVRFTDDESDPNRPFKVVASPFGVQLQGFSRVYTGNAELEELASIIGAAFDEFHALRPKIARSLAGH